MAQDEIQQLKTELETLRRENLLLRQRTGTRSNGHAQALPETVRHDNLLPAFQQQLTRLREAHQQLRAAHGAVGELQRSLETLIPALEIQMTGWTNEIHHLQAAQQDLEQTYATVVGRLEDRIKTLKGQVAQASPAALQQQLTALEKERERMRRRIEELEETCRQQEADPPSPDPHTSATRDQGEDPFNIFGV